MTSLARVPFKSDHLQSMLVDEPPAALQASEKTSRVLTIRATDSEGHRSSARVLVDRLYADRGYESSAIAAAPLERGITLVGTDHDVARGTITIAFDDSHHLLADECFPDVLADLRHEGAVLCEFVKLAIDGVGRSRRVLASLFHTAFMYAREIKGCDRVVVEVNPRHVSFYKRMLGFSALTGERPNLRVNAPAVLLSLDLSYAERQIRNVQRAAREAVRIERSLYRDCFSHDEAAVIVRRLRDRTPS